MKLDRKEVELAQAQFYRLGQDMLAELCKAWLALDAAPVGTLRDSIDFDGDTGMDESEARALIGQRVRLVATSGGDREDC